MLKQEISDFAKGAFYAFLFWAFLTILYFAIVNILIHTNSIIFDILI